MKTNRQIVKTFLFFQLVCIFCADKAFSFDFDKAVVESVRLVHQAKSLEEQGRYEEALKKYHDALAHELNKYRWEEASARGGIVKVYINMKRYDDALNAMDWFLEENKNPKAALERIKEIKELKKYQKTNDPQGVHEYIKFYRKEYEHFLPPKNWFAGSDIYISTILRLYDTIGDHDAGIKFIDEILDWTHQTDNDFKHLKGRINDSQQASECIGLDKPVKERNPDWRACKWLREYLLVREAFEKDKAEGTKGRATQALIQSDYFPW